MFNAPKSPQWSVDVYRVTDHECQQRVLATFLSAGRPAVTALGTQNGAEWFVAIETHSADDRRWSRRTVTALDAKAVTSYSTGQSPLSGPVLA